MSDILIKSFSLSTLYSKGEIDIKIELWSCEDDPDFIYRTFTIEYFDQYGVKTSLSFPEIVNDHSVLSQLFSKVPDLIKQSDELRDKIMQAQNFLNETLPSSKD